MKTDDLIHLLAQDSQPVRPLSRALKLALVVALAMPFAILILTVGLRPNIAEAIYWPRVEAKIGITFLAAVVSCLLVFRIGRPGVSVRFTARGLGLPVALLAVAIVVELFVLPSGEWPSRLIGKHAAFCVTFIPVLAAIPLLSFLWALKEGAPDNPAFAGAAAGLAAGSIAASFYAWHCPDDSPLFLATWYGLAILGMVVIGALAGRRILVW